MQFFADTKKLVLAALLTTIGVVLNLAEGFFPLTLPVPGAKIGLANIAILLCLYLLPLQLTAAVFFMRILLTSLLLGTIFSTGFFIGIVGGLLSFFAMLTVKNHFTVSTVGISMIGAAAHNTGQVLMASLLIDNFSLLYYLPPALLLAIPAGLLTGIVAKFGVFTLGKLHVEKY